MSPPRSLQALASCHHPQLRQADSSLFWKKTAGRCCLTGQREPPRTATAMPISPGGHPVAAALCSSRSPRWRTFSASPLLGDGGRPRLPHLAALSGFRHAATKDFANAATYNIEARYTAYLSGFARPPPPPSVPSGTDSVPSGHADPPVHRGGFPHRRPFERAGSQHRPCHLLLHAWTFWRPRGICCGGWWPRGHGIGILIAGDGADALQQIQRGNEALCRAAFSKTRLIYRARRARRGPPRRSGRQGTAP